MNTQHLHQTLGDLASAHPAATRIFLRHRLDFCCGGRRTLAEACAEAGLDPQAIAAELDAETAGQAPAGWNTRPLPELADHIEQRYHASLRRDVPVLLEAARKVERVHAGRPDVPAGLAEALADFWDEMQGHMLKEENVLFPAIRRGVVGQAIYMPVRVMEQEHDAHAENLARLRRLAHGFDAPAHACGTWRALYDGLAALEADLMEHISLENNTLFLRAMRET